MNNIINNILSLLGTGDYHSGSAIGRRIGVSRAAVWKQLQKLVDLGLDLESVKGKGYRLVGGFEALSNESIYPLLNLSAKDHMSALEIFSHLESTNSYTMNRISEGGAKGYVCLAEYQSAGKGRRGRKWVSPFGHNIYLSLAWEFDGGASQLEGLSLAVGVAIVQSLREIGLEKAELKWPNDILLDKKKLGGILLEMQGDPSGVCQVVIGVGINVRMKASAVIDQPWTSIANHLSDVSRNELAGLLLNNLFAMLLVYEREGFSKFKTDWERMDALQAEKVVVVTGTTRISGIANGVYPNGALRLTVEGVDQPIYGGEVSLRRVSDN
ncbi:MAG: BirA family biotin operon repressor/biotin-[acetyl-CoA-carboxylase] ligase [Candidatus Endobugula sp.]|jgi:BirA family biotin operon repressor/biotin-[acetyl-CoA-carboxylase] ligase